MPGPLAATWMSVRSFEKNAVRATILAFFIFAYGANILSYFIFSGITPETINLAFVLLPALVIGIAAGGLITRKLSEGAFRKALLVVLISTITILLSSLL